MQALINFCIIIVSLHVMELCVQRYICMQNVRYSLVFLADIPVPGLFLACSLLCKQHKSVVTIK